MYDDVADDLEEVEKEHSLVSIMLKIQACGVVRIRDFSSVQNLTCLSVHCPEQISKQDHLSQKTLYQVERPQYDRDFVAVSYPWGTATNERNGKGDFRIATEASDSYKKSQVRNTVLNRVVQYLENSKCSAFWIDKDCIDQENKVAKEAAMQTMDIVYRRSRDSVGLLSVSIDKERDINLLLRLMSGRAITNRGRRQVPRLAADVGLYKARKLLSLLCRIASDCWWSRRWIFQEEYCAGTNMHLLITHTPELNSIKQTGTDVFGGIDGELRINASNFREQVTLFCIASEKAKVFRSRHDRRRCERLFRTLKRYSTLERFGPSIGDDSTGRPMSTRILTDICRRDVSHPEDTLAVVANCCGYSIRLDTEHLENIGVQSLSMALLTMVILNGEILRNDVPYRAASLPAVLKSHSLDSIKPPHGHARLTFMKRCRLVNVKLCKTGIMTAGHLWCVRSIVSTEDFPSPIPPERVDWRWQCLRSLADQIGTAHSQLARSICSFLDSHQLRKSEAWLRGGIPVHMAAEVAVAVRRRQDLLIACNQHHSEAWAIFLRGRSCRKPVKALSRQLTPAPKLIFTAHEHADPHRNVRRSRFLEKYVSIEVMDAGADACGTLQLQTGAWINGICFPGKIPPRDMLFPWPAGLRRG